MHFDLKISALSSIDPRVTVWSTHGHTQRADIFDPSLTPSTAHSPRVALQQQEQGLLSAPLPYYNYYYMQHLNTHFLH